MQAVRPTDDGYNVMQAITEYEAQRGGSTNSRRQEDLEALLIQQLQQASKLLQRVRGKSGPNANLEHYSKVCGYMLEEVGRLQTELRTDYDMMYPDLLAKVDAMKVELQALQCGETRTAMD